MRMRGLDPNKTYIGPLETQTVGASAKAPKADEAASSAIVKFDAKIRSATGGESGDSRSWPLRGVRGGQAPMPAAGTTFSGSMGATVPEAAAGVPHGTIRPRLPVLCANRAVVLCLRRKRQEAARLTKAT